LILLFLYFPTQINYLTQSTQS